ncbi:uncharacterized protein BKCO1_7500027 [Diplodia corticola]|uniref:Uncharacterized protein n=1 Tax=Diplodia corticola TaxID=236234 RepID=A0A1J9RQ62_9PEZI|nr:uncharacterized protein BKCO1_7500027 [Diplodia corticola]OJD29693.1 hypothetical protein BKCO1_7500027 [Diplodia corticola]
MPDDNPHMPGWGGLPRVMKEQVLVTWNGQDEGDEQYFGCLSPTNDKCDDSKRGLSLEVYASEGEEHAVLVKFHLSVWTPAARTKKPRDMYVILPTPALSMTRHLVNAVPENVRNHLPHAPSYNRIHFELSDSGAPRHDVPSDPPPYNEKDLNPDSSSGPEVGWRTSPLPAALLSKGVAAQTTTTTKRKKAEAGFSSNEGAVVHKHPRQAPSGSDSEPDQGGRLAAFDPQLALAQELPPTEADPEFTAPGNEPPLVPPPNVPRDPSSSPQPFPSSTPTEQAKEGLAQPRLPAAPYHQKVGDVLHYKMVHFFLYALRRDGDAITNYAKDFLEMGHHVNAVDDKAFRAVKHRCYSSLATRSARHGFPAPSTPDQISDQVNVLLDWLDDAISEEAYALLDRHYACLAGMVADAEAGAGFVQEEFEIRRADFYAAAFRVADGIMRDCPERPPLLCAESVHGLCRSYSSFR